MIYDIISYDISYTSIINTYYMLKYHIICEIVVAPVLYRLTTTASASPRDQRPSSIKPQLRGTGPMWGISRLHGCVASSIDRRSHSYQGVSTVSGLGTDDWESACEEILPKHSTLAFVSMVTRAAQEQPNPPTPVCVGVGSGRVNDTTPPPPPHPPSPPWPLRVV